MTDTEKRLLTAFHCAQSDLARHRFDILDSGHLAFCAPKWFGYKDARNYYYIRWAVHCAAKFHLMGRTGLRDEFARFARYIRDGK